MSSEQCVISISGLSKCYQIYDQPRDRLKQAIVPRLARLVSPFIGGGPRVYYREFWALRDVSFQVERGETVGILGRNGAGKSTLLQIIAGTVMPTSGTADANGRIAALLELGSGFNPEFTGRENVFLSAALFGLSLDETRARFSDIESFADIGDFINQPIKVYSSGMVMRLAFAVQTALKPEILIVDEALSVGDVRFQKKCFGRLERFRNEGGTVLFVTHDTGTVVQICTRAIVLENGQLVDEGDPRHIVRVYHRLLFGSELPVNSEPQGKEHDESDAGEATQPANSMSHEEGGSDSNLRSGSKNVAAASKEVRYGTREAEILSVGMRDRSQAETTVIETNETCEFYFALRFNAAIAEPVSYGFIISNAKGVEIYGTKSALMGRFLPGGPAGTRFECSLKTTLPLVPGVYLLTVALAPGSSEGSGYYDCRFDALEFRVIGTPRCFLNGVIDMPAVAEHRSIATATQ